VDRDVWRLIERYGRLIERYEQKENAKRALKVQ